MIKTSKAALMAWTFTLTLFASAIAQAVPSIAINAPTTNQTLSGTQATIQAAVTSALPISQVKFYRDGWVPIGVRTSAPYQVTIDTSVLSNGPHQVFATAVDSSGTVASAIVSVQVNNVAAPATATSTTTSSGTTASTGTTAAPASATPTITSPRANAVLSAIATLSVNASAYGTFGFWVDDANQGFSGNSASPYQLRLDTTRFANGTHTLVVKRYDQTTGSWIPSGSVVFNVSNGPSGSASTGTTAGTTASTGTTAASVVTPATASATTAAAPSTFMLGLWLWNSDEVLSDATQQNQLVSSAKSAGVTDIFLFVKAAAYTEAISHDRIRAFNALMSRNGIHVWGLEGWRGYFSDAYGPKDFYAAVDNLVLFNKGVAANERFVGFQSDMEPQDGQETFKTSFHNDLTDAQLSTTGGGVWYPTQAQDREMLMRDWLTIHETAHDKLAAAGLKMAAAMPFWTENYYGSAVMVTYKNVRQSVGSHMMNYLNDYIVMSYNTDRNNAAGRVQLQARYASSLPAATRPRISAAMETHAGVGVNVSYADTPGTNSRQVVLSDMAAIRSILSAYPAFSGVSLHDWVGWKSLNP